MDALTERTIRRLAERLEVFRLRGPIPALMAEFRVGAPAEETLPLDGFADALWGDALRQLPDGTQLSRRVWLAAAPAVVAEFRNFCRDAGRVAVPALHVIGYRVGIGSADPISSWLWAIFELAESRLPGTDLRLDGEDVFRSAGRGILAGERVLHRAKLHPGEDSLADAFAASAGATRYWKLANAVEASLAVLDIAQTRREPTPTGHQTATPPNGRRHRSTRKIDVDGALGKLEAKLRKELVREHGSESAAQAALIESLYSLSAEALVPMLKSIGFKISARTIYRPGNSQKYEAWVRYRRPNAPASADLDVGPAALSDVRPRAADVADDAVDSGQLSRRTGGRGTTRIGKTAAEKATEDAADRFAREAGIDLPPAE